jgi:hypothetical protein
MPGPEKIRAQQLGKLPRIDAIALVSDLEQNCSMVSVFVSRMDSITNFPVESNTVAEIVA